MTSPTRTDPVRAIDLEPLTRSVARIAAQREDARLVELIRSAFLPFRPEVQVARFDAEPTTIGVRIVADGATVYRVPVDVAQLHRYGPAEVAELVAREVRRMWHLEDTPADPPTIVRGSD